MKQLTALKSFLPTNPILWVCIIGLVAYFLGTCGRPTPPDENVTAHNEWKEVAERVIAQNDSANAKVVEVLARADSAEKANALKDQQIARLNTSLRRQRAVNDSVRAALAENLPDTCDSALALADAYRAEADTAIKAKETAEALVASQKVIIADLRVGVTTLKTSNDSLRQVILDVPVPKPDKLFGFIPKPSRKTAFVVGAVAGAAGAVWVHGSLR